MKLAALLLIFPAVCAAQIAASLCEAPSEISAAVKEAHQKPKDSRADTFRALLQQYPDDLWVNRAYQDSARDGMLFKPSVIDEYKAAAQKHPESPAYLYFYGRVLVGTSTPEAISAFDHALAQDAEYAPAHLSLVEIYRAPNFKDPDKARAHLEAWMNICPAQFDGFHDLERMENSDFVRNSVARMRTMIESRDDSAALAHYRTLWTLEFQVHAATEYEQIRERIRKDLLRLRSMDLSTNPSLSYSLREGYKLVGDKEGLAWIDEQSPVKSAATGSAPMGSAPMEAFQEWQKRHPYPSSKPGEPISQDAFKARNKALLEVTAEWIRKWPNDDFIWSQRLQALQMNRDVPDSEVQEAADALLKRYQPGPAKQPPHFQIASLYLQRNMHLRELPALVNQGLNEMDKTPPVQRTSDLYPQNVGLNAQSMRWNMTFFGLSTLCDVYVQMNNLQFAHDTLAKLRTVLDQNKPAASANDFEKQQWARSDGGYWDKMAQCAEREGHKLDALTYLQNEARETANSGSNEYIKRRAKTLWTDLGGTEEGWKEWATHVEAPKTISVAAGNTRWEEMNRVLPEFELTDMAGKTWRLADLKGKTTLINLWATWCGPCREELPHLQKLYDKLKDRPDIRILTLNTDDNPGLIEPFLNENKYTFPVLPARTYVDQLVPSLSIPRNWIVDQQAVMKRESIGFGMQSGDWVQAMSETLEKASK